MIGYNKMTDHRKKELQEKPMRSQGIALSCETSY